MNSNKYSTCQAVLAAESSSYNAQLAVSPPTTPSTLAESASGSTLSTIETWLEEVEGPTSASTVTLYKDTSQEEALQKDHTLQTLKRKRSPSPQNDLLQTSPLPLTRYVLEHFTREMDGEKVSYTLVLESSGYARAVVIEPMGLDRPRLP